LNWLGRLHSENLRRRTSSIRLRAAPFGDDGLNAKILIGAVAVIGVTLSVTVKKEPRPLVIELPTPTIVPPAPYVEPPAYVEPPQPKTISTVPRQCLPYKRRIINESRNWWGLDGYPATFAAQIEQE